MIEINLLPKKYRKSDSGFKLGKVEVLSIAAAAAIVLAMAGITWYQVKQVATLERDITEAQKRTQQLSSDIRLVDGLLDMKQKIAERMQAVERLDRHRGVWVRIMEDLTQRVPDFVWLAEIKEVVDDKTKKVKTTTAWNGQIVTDTTASTKKAPEVDPNVHPMEIQGYSFTLNALASFMIKLMRSNYFTDVDLVYAKESVLDKKRAFEFKLSGNLHYLSDEDLRNMLAASDAEEKIFVQDPSDTALAEEMTN